LPKTINDNNIPILFADDTSIIVKSPTLKDFQTKMVEAFDSVYKWFKVNSLSINVKKNSLHPSYQDDDSNITTSNLKQKISPYLI
jgi:hypothetical protein